jgi:hypothetical protein
MKLKILLDKILNPALQNSKRQVLEEIAITEPARRSSKEVSAIALTCEMHGDGLA